MKKEWTDILLKDKKPLYPSPHISFSSITAYSDCPRWWRYKYIDKLKQITTPEMAVGRKLHGLFKVINMSAKEMGDQLGSDDIKEMFDMAVRGLNLKMTFSSKCLDAVMSYAQKIYGESERIFAAELQLSVKLEDEGQEIWAVGGLDLVMMENYVAEIIDFKTSAFVPSQKEVEYDDQLAMYSYFLKENYPSIMGISNSIYSILSWIKTEPVVRDIKKLGYVEEWLIDRWRTIRNDKEYKPNVPSNKCDQCPKVCDEYKAYIKRKFESKGWTTLEEMATGLLTVKTNMKVLKAEDKLLSAKMEKAIDENLGEPIVAGGQEWYVIPGERLEEAHEDKHSIFTMLKHHKLGAATKIKNREKKKVSNIAKGSDKKPQERGMGVKNEIMKILGNYKKKG